MIATDTLPPIGLDELVQRAALLTRIDRKYLLPTVDLPFLLDMLADEVAVLEIGGRREFGYRSVYFDTPELDSYLSTARRRRRRFKVRVRSYLDADRHFVEVKTRGPRGTTVKQRTRYTGDGRELGPGGQAHTDAVLADAGIRSEPLRLEPVLTTHYRRTTLFVPSCGSRVTVDTRLTWSLPDGAAVHAPGLAVVETKSARASSRIDRLLWSLKYRPSSISKYGTGLAALRPELPSHRWRPVLQRHFHPTTEGR